MTVARSLTRPPAQTSSTCNRTRSQPLSLLSMARLKRARSRARCSSCSRIRIAQTSLGLRGRFCPVIRPLFQGAFFGRSDVCISPSMIVSVEPTTPSQHLPIGGRGNIRNDGSQHLFRRSITPSPLAAFDPLRTLGGTRSNVGLWRQCREPRPLHDLPDGRGHGAATEVPGIPDVDRPTSGAARTSVTAR